jgi:molybdopterin synthase sulfur carrier subunit
MIKVLYFAWVRERIGVSYEMVETESETIIGLVDELRQRAPRYEIAFADLSTLKVAVNQELCDFDTKLSGASEIAFFPPMTGG